MTHRSMHRLFGVTLATDHPLSLTRHDGDDAPDVTFRVVDHEPAGADWSTAELRYSTPVAPDRAEPDFHFYRLADRDVIRITGAADFHVADDHITCHLPDPRHGYVIEIALFGLVMAFWLERLGRETYHAAALVPTEDAAVAFLATSGTGKSSLAADLLADGARLLTEDLLAVTWADDTPLAQPGPPQLRLWPEVAARVVEAWEDLDQPHPDFDKRRVPVGPLGIGAMSHTAVPLRRFYVLQRLPAGTTGPTIEPLADRAAVVELLRHSYLPHESARFGWQARRLEQVVRVLATVPLRRLRYPSGTEHLPRVRELLLEDLAGATP